MNVLGSPSGEDPIEIEALFRASPERVFAAFTEPEKFARWFGGGEAGPYAVEIDLKVGGAWRAVFSDGPEGRFFVEGAYTIVDPVTRLAFTWRAVEEKTGAAPSVSPVSEVTVTLEPDGAATRLKLRHAGVSAAGRKNVGSGWGEAFGSLERFLAESA